MKRGRGARVVDVDGNEYIDCVAGQGSGVVGHCHPQISAAVAEQLGELTLCTEAFHHPRRAELQRRLVERATPGIERVYLCNSGAEAAEAALKFARIATGRTGFIAAMRGFHGRTLGALSATFEKSYREPFEPLVPGFQHVPYGDLGALDQAIGEDTAGVMLEVVQGEGGVRPATTEYLRAAQELCRSRGALLIADEVQTGCGRTGRFLACEHHGLEPDLITLAKSLGGGLPIGAVLIGQRVGPLPPRTHGSTFGGNPLSCAAALAVMDVVEEALLARSRRLGTQALERWRRLDAPMVREVRGLGLMLGIELKTKVTPLLQKLTECGVLALPAGPTVLRFLPPLVIEDDDWEGVLDKTSTLLTQLKPNPRRRPAT